MFGYVIWNGNCGIHVTVSSSMRSDSSNGCSPGTHMHDPDGHGLPELLRRARECRGLTLEQLARDTKIPASRLAAFEHDELTGKDIGFYVRAQIRAYARALNLDERVVVAELNRESPPPPTPTPAIPHVTFDEPEARVPVWRVPRAPVAIGLVIAAVVAGRLMAGLEFWSADNADTGVVPASSPARPDAPVATSVSASDIPPSVGAKAETAAERTQSDHVPTSFESAPPATFEAQALRTAGSPAPGPAVPPAGAVAGRASTPSVTELVVTSEPPGARVTVNGIGWGETPITIRHLPAGPKRIRVTKDGYVAAERVVSVAEGSARRVAVDLRTP